MPLSGKPFSSADKRVQVHGLMPNQDKHLVTSATQIRVFHALGGSTEWFKRVAIPHIRYWGAHVSGVTVTADRSGKQVHSDRSAIEYLIDQGLCMLDSWLVLSTLRQSVHRAPFSPASKLMKLHQAVMDGVWCLMQSVQIKAKDGSVWTLGEPVLEVWFEQHGRDSASLSLVNGVQGDIWNEAIFALRENQIWSESPSGRWLACRPFSLLLWPLAGRDLQHTLKGMGYPEFSIEYLRRSLKQWGYTNPDCLSGELFPWIRPDGKTFFGLRATARLGAFFEGQSEDWINQQESSEVAIPALMG